MANNKQKALLRSAFAPIVISLMYGVINRVLAGIVFVTEFPYVAVGELRPLLQGAIMLGIVIVISLAYEMDYLTPEDASMVPKASVLERIAGRVANVLVKRTSRYEIQDTSQEVAPETDESTDEGNTTSK